MDLEVKARPDYFWFGTGMHWALEDCHGYNKYGHPAQAFWAYYQACKEAHTLPPTADELILVGIGMMQYYWDIWLKEQDRQPLPTLWVNGTPMCELRFEIPLPMEDGEGNQLSYRGTIDRVIEDEHGRLWVGEYKSAKAFRLYHFDTDDQITAYATTFDTEALTRTGWKTHDQLVIGEEILGYNHETRSLEWTVLENIHYPGTLPTVTISNKSFEFTCHKDHKWAQVNENNKWPKEDEGRFELKPIKQGQQHHRVILSATYHQGTSGITPDEAAVIAWLLTDGTYQNGCESICQSRSKYATEVQMLLDKFDNAYSRISDRSGCNIYHLRSPFFMELWNKAGLNRSLDGWEQFLLGLSQEAIQAFCKAAMMAEGDANGQFYQNKGRKQDIFRMAFFLSGRFPSKGHSSGGGEEGFPNQGICEAFTPGTPEKWVRTIKVTENKIAQPVWCTQTGLHTWVMRQNGQIAITGNCCALQAIFPDREVAGVCYQQHRKMFPTPPKILKSGRVSTAANMSTSRGLYNKVLRDVYGTWDNYPADNKAYLHKLASEEDIDGDAFIRRDWIYRNNHQMAAQWEKIMMELEDMTRPNLPLYPNPGKDCAWQCPLESVCVAMDDGSDWESLLESLTIQRLPNSQEEQDKWRNHLQPLENLPLLPQLPEDLNLLEHSQLPSPQEQGEEGRVMLLEMLGLQW